MPFLLVMDRATLLFLSSDNQSRQLAQWSLLVLVILLAFVWEPVVLCGQGGDAVACSGYCPFVGPLDPIQAWQWGTVTSFPPHRCFWRDHHLLFLKTRLEAANARPAFMLPDRHHSWAGSKSRRSLPQPDRRVTGIKDTCYPQLSTGYYYTVLFAGQTDSPFLFSGGFGFCSFLLTVLKSLYVSLELQGEQVGDTLGRGRKWERHMWETRMPPFPGLPEFLCPWVAGPGVLSALRIPSGLFFWESVAFFMSMAYEKNVSTHIEGRNWDLYCL